MSHPEIRVTPANGLVDQRRSIELIGFSTGPVHIETTLQHPDGSVWRSTATFLANHTQSLNLDLVKPIAGDWSRADAMATVWAMKPQTSPTKSDLSDDVEPWRFTIQASNEQGETAQTQWIESFSSPSISRQEICENGIVGTVFRSSDRADHPVVVVLNGSGGGIPRQRAALLASHGFTAFALGYFKAPGLPKYISHTPLEYFQKALRWARDNLSPKAGFVALTGQSRGGELSLLLASRFPTLINAVAAYVPSAVIHGTLRAGAPGEKPDSPAWTWEGKPLTNVWYQNRTADWSAFLAKNRTNSTPVRQAPSFVSAQNDQQAVDRARILVENIQGPIAFIAGTDDGFWPSVGYTRSMVQTLNTHQHPWPILELIETGAGHAIGIPFTPATQIAKQHPVAKILLTGGGSAATNAKASENSWPQVIQFLASAAKNKELSQ